MKRITLLVEETATYKRTYEVEDNFDVGNLEALEELWCADPDAVTKGCQSVDDRHIRVIRNEDVTSLF